MKQAILKNKSAMALSFLGDILEILAELTFAYFFMITIDFATGDLDISLKALIAIGLGVSLIKMVFTFINEKTKAYVTNKVMSTWKVGVLRDYLDKENDKTPSEVINLVTNVGARLEANVLTPVLTIIKLSIFLLGASIVLFKLNWQVLVFYLATSWLPLVLPRIFNKKTQEKIQKAMMKEENFISKAREVTSGYEIIKSFAIEKKMGAIIEEESKDTHRESYKAASFQYFHQDFTAFFSILIIVGGMILAYYFAYKGRISLGQASAVLQISNYIQQPLMGIPICLIKINSMKGENTGVLEESGQKALSGNRDFSLEDRIEAGSLTYSYDGDNQVLKGLDFEVKKGDKCAIIGPSGCGKSTIAKVLMRRLKDYGGSVKIDGKELRDIDMESFYKEVAPVNQEVFIFNDTIKNNITLYNKDLEKGLDEAIDGAGLRGLVDSLDKGVETLLGEYGQDLSGGEKQRIAIARCLVKKSQLIIMDEATSSLDPATARDIESLLASLDQTIIVVTHRLDDDILSKYDKVFKMGKGVIEACGSWEDVKEN